MNNQYSLKSIYIYTLPIIFSELLEEFTILSDSILLSFKEPVYLSTVGIIDSIFLLFLTIGESLNDSFQNFYSRNCKNFTRCKGVFTSSLILFIGIGVGFAFLFSLISIFHEHFNGEHLTILVSAIPYLAILIVLSFISLSLNSLLMGWGFTKFLGWVSIFSVSTNFVLGYLLLYILDTGLNPCIIVIVTSSFAELFAGICMMLKILQLYRPNRDKSSDCRHQTRIFQTLVYASVFPSLSGVGFHLGSLALYTYCLCFLFDAETAIFTLFMSYWGVLQVPSQGFAETAINFYSNIYAKKKKHLYSMVKNRLLYLSILTSLFIWIAIVILDSCLYKINMHKMLLFGILLGIVGLNTFGEITDTSLLVRLKNNSFILSKVYYTIILVLCLAVLTSTNHVRIINIFICFFIAQLFNCCYLGIKDYHLWMK
jgi:Na+-driven multidrug efflux pump